MKKIFCVFMIFVFCVPVLAEEIFVPWEFEIYEEAEFSSRVTGRFGAQNIEVIEQCLGGWVFAEVNDSTWGWINLRNAPAIGVLDEFFSPLGNNISVFYMNLETGFTYTHNADRVFFAASLSKSNHALYAYMLAERGLINIYEVQTYRESDFWGGTGVMRFMSHGLQFTTRELLGLSIRESDNAAFRMLVRLFADSDFSYRDFVNEIGADTAMIRDVISQNTTARDAGLFMYNIWNYIEGENRFGHYLRHDMLNTAQVSHPHWTRWEGSNGMGDNGIGTNVNIQMIRSDYPFARKYGWANNSFHDAGIVYAPSPYILVILSNMHRGAHDLFEEISWFVQDFNHKHFVAPVPLNAPFHGPENYRGQSAALLARIAQNDFLLTIPTFADADYLT
jgi:beta-lactamase class A